MGVWKANGKSRYPRRCKLSWILEQIGKKLTAEIQNVTVIRSFEVKEERAFLLTFKSRKPDWSLLGLDGIDRLPAVSWKLKNLENFR